MDLIQAIILGIVQGITEWLPISSSGHLVIAQELFGLDVPLLFDAALHLASLAVLFIVFWKDIVRVGKGLIRLDFKDADFRLGVFVVLASAITGIIGIAFHDFFRSLFSNIKAVGIALLGTGLLLLMTRFIKEREGRITWKNAAIIGLFQGLAIIPGVSRSGATIGSGLLLGIEKETCARFSFLIAIAPIIGANFYELFFGEFSASQVGLMAYLAGMLVTFIAGYVSLKLLLMLVRAQKLWLFSIYCFILGIGIMVFI